jgi:hypothetical protein
VGRDVHDLIPEEHAPDELNINDDHINDDQHSHVSAAQHNPHAHDDHEQHTPHAHHPSDPGAILGGDREFRAIFHHHDREPHVDGTERGGAEAEARASDKSGDKEQTRGSSKDKEQARGSGDKSEDTSGTNKSGNESGTNKEKAESNKYIRVSRRGLKEKVEELERKAREDRIKRAALFNKERGKIERLRREQLKKGELKKGELQKRGKEEHRLEHGSMEDGLEHGSMEHSDHGASVHSHLDPLDERLYFRGDSSGNSGLSLTQLDKHNSKHAHNNLADHDVHNRDESRVTTESIAESESINNHWRPTKRGDVFAHIRENNINSIFLAESRKPTKRQVANALKAQTTQLMKLLRQSGVGNFAGSAAFEPFNFEEAFAKLDGEAAPVSRDTMSTGSLSLAEVGSLSLAEVLTGTELVERNVDTMSGTTTSHDFGQYGGRTKFFAALLKWLMSSLWRLQCTIAKKIAASKSFPCGMLALFAALEVRYIITRSQCGL